MSKIFESFIIALLIFFIQLFIGTICYYIIVGIMQITSITNIAILLFLLFVNLFLITMFVYKKIN